ncbi:MAG TPA: cytochrome P450, partial [Solirubrobacteraceae bacterium]|nr:cytochrome P450 [Solirubrobacteraceae bacterium]
LPPALHRSRLIQTLTFGARPLSFMLSPSRRLGDVWQLKLLSREEPMVITCHPDHVESLFKAKPDDAPSLTGESPLRPILGPNSVLTMVGERHMRERKLLLPPFHGDAVKRYVRLISQTIEREIARWPEGRPFSLAPRMQAVTLDVIMAGVFGIEGRPAPGTPEHRIRETIRRLQRLSTRPAWQLIELFNLGRAEPRGPMRVTLGFLDRQLYPAIRERRAAGPRDDGSILSLLLETRDEDGQPLSDQHVRDELISMVLAGHETTANSLAWTFERLVRNPEPYARLRELVRSGDAEEAEAYVEATIHEGMRVRPVIPMIVRLVKRRWQLGDYVVGAQTPVAVSIVALHHRPDVYPDPHRFRPERFVGQKPGTYTWIPFGGGIRRCLGASLAMAEQRVVLSAVARHTDLKPADPSPEPARQRNVTMIPGFGGRVVLSRPSGG